MYVTATCVGSKLIHPTVGYFHWVSGHQKGAIKCFTSGQALKSIKMFNICNYQRGRKKTLFSMEFDMQKKGANSLMKEWGDIYTKKNIYINV